MDAQQMAMTGGLIVALVKALRSANLVKKRFAPLAALGMGAAAGVIYGGATSDWSTVGCLSGIVPGLVSGTSATGLHAVGTKTIPRGSA